MCWCLANKMFFSLLILPSIHLLATSPIPKPYKEESHTHHLHNIITYPLPTPLSSLLAARSVRLPGPSGCQFPRLLTPFHFGSPVPARREARTCLRLQSKTSVTNFRLLCSPGAVRRPLLSSLGEKLRRQWPDSVSWWPLLRVGDNREEHCIFPGCPGATYNGAPTILFASTCSTPKLRH